MDTKLFDHGATRTFVEMWRTTHTEDDMTKVQIGQSKPSFDMKYSYARDNYKAWGHFGGGRGQSRIQYGAYTFDSSKSLIAYRGMKGGHVTGVSFGPTTAVFQGFNTRFGQATFRVDKNDGDEVVPSCMLKYGTYAVGLSTNALLISMQRTFDSNRYKKTVRVTTAVSHEQGEYNMRAHSHASIIHNNEEWSVQPFATVDTWMAQGACKSECVVGVSAYTDSVRVGLVAKDDRLGLQLLLK